MWFTRQDNEIANRIVPELKQDKNGRSVTRWRLIDVDNVWFNDPFVHFYHVVGYAPTISQRDRRLPRGGLKVMQERRDAFIESVSDGEDGMYSAVEYMKAAFRDRDFELMGVYEKFITKENQKSMVRMVHSCVAALRAMGRMDIENELTEEHFAAHTMIARAVSEVACPPMVDTVVAYYASGLLWVAFTDLALAPKLASFVTSSGTTDMRVVLKRLPEIKSTHASMMEGVL